jgi:hypothetical protein
MQQMTLLEAFQRAAGFTQTVVGDMTKELQYKYDTDAFNREADLDKKLAAVTAQAPDYQNDPAKYQSLLDSTIGEWATDALGKNQSRYYQDRINRIAEQARVGAAQKTQAMIAAHERDELAAADVERWETIANMENPDAIHRGLNDIIDRRLDAGLINESQAATQRVEAAARAFKKDIAVPETVTDFEAEKARLEAVAADSRYAAVTGRDKDKDIAITDAQRKYCDYNFTVYREAEQLFTNAVRNKDYVTAASIQAKWAPERDRLVRESGAEKISQDQAERLDGFFRDVDLEKWKTPDPTKENSEIENLIENRMTEWYAQINGETGQREPIDGVPIIELILANKEAISAGKFTSWLGDLINANDKDITGTNLEIARMKKIIELRKPKEKDGKPPMPEAMAAYDKYLKDSMAAIAAERIRGNLDLSRFIDGEIQLQSADYLDAVVLYGDIGTEGPLGKADETLKAYTYHSNRGLLDFYDGEQITAKGAEPLTVGNLGLAIPQLMDLGKRKMDALLAGTGMQVSGIGIREIKASGDKTGALQFMLTNGKRGRLNNDSVDGDLYVEILEGDKWVKVERPLSNPQMERNNRRLDAYYERGGR